MIELVRQQPEDVGALQAYAAALTAAGDPLGELIQVQLALEQGRDELKEREQALLLAHEAEWLASLGGPVSAFVWWRGLLGIDTTVDGFLRHGPALVAARCVRFIDIADESAAVGADEWSRLLLQPELSSVTMLRIRGRYVYDDDEVLLDDRDVEALAASPHAARLIGLDLCFNAVGDAGVVALARSPLAGRLEELELRCCRYGDTALEAVAGFPRLRLLDLSYCDGAPTAAGWRALVGSPHLGGASSIYLAGNRIDPEVRAAAIARWGDAVDVGS